MADHFIEAVEDARAQLIRQEGRGVSVRELLRRAGIPESKRAGAAYHLNARKFDGTGQHRVPPDLVRHLAAVLPISEAQLAEAAFRASGLQATEPTDGNAVVAAVLAYYAGEADDDERRRVTASILRTISDHLDG